MFIIFDKTFNHKIRRSLELKEMLKKKQLWKPVMNFISYLFIMKTKIVYCIIAIIFILIIITLYKQNKRLEIQENHINELTEQIQIEDDHKSLESPHINTKVQEIESRLEDVEDSVD